MIMVPSHYMAYSCMSNYSVFALASLDHAALPRPHWLDGCSLR